jgi:hypothetical protein
MAAEFRLSMSVKDGSREQEEETKRISRYRDNLLLGLWRTAACDNCSNAVLFNVKKNLSLEHVTCFNFYSSDAIIQN